MEVWEAVPEENEVTKPMLDFIRQTCPEYFDDEEEEEDDVAVKLEGVAIKDESA